MKDFLKEYWPWIAVPFVLVVGGLLLAFFLMSDGGASPFVYNVYGFLPALPSRTS